MALMKFREKNQVKWVGVRPGHNGEQVSKDAQADNAIAIIYTVPAGKVFYWLHYICHGMNITGVGHLFVRNDADVHQYQLVALRMATNVGSSNCISGNFNPPLEVPANWDICVQSYTPGYSFHAFIHGWEE